MIKSGQPRKNIKLLPPSCRTVINGVDIDRLHWVIENRPNIPRGSGMTFARIQEFIGMVECGVSEFCLLISLYRDIQYLNPMIFEQLKNRGISFEYNPKLRRITSPQFDAVYATEHDMTKVCRGQKLEIIYLRHLDQIS